MSNNKRYHVGVDIGGTFTDFVMHDAQSQEFILHKALTTPDDPSRSVVAGTRHMLNEVGASGDDVALVVHGTTLITNALIERKGAKTAFVTTGGYRDVLEIGTEIRYDAYDLAIDKPEPLVPRQLRFGVDERLDNRGAIVRPLDAATLDQIVAALRDNGIESVGVSFLHSFRNPEHEQQAGAKIKEALPGTSVSLSSDVAPEIREYQRASTTVANAYVKPLTERYLARLQEQLQELGYEQELYLMLSSGGISSSEVASSYPIQLLESGPAGGVLCAAFIGRAIGRDELVSFDMGGTTAKMAYVSDGVPLLARSFEVARVSRFRMGSGLPVQVPVIEMIEIGAGGGSIAHRDSLGLLKVGPESAGADPGPACYGFGGEKPTVTDANLVLGYLAPDGFLGGDMQLSVEAAKEAIRTWVAEPLGLGVVEAARGIFDVVNENMVSATKVHIAEKGKDPRRASLVAFGGAGPVHAHALTKALGMRELICPLRAGVASALGFLTAPMAFDFAQSVASPLSDLTASELGEIVASMEERGAETLAAAGAVPENVRHSRSADMRYVGQGHEIEVPLPDGEIHAEYVDALIGHFEAKYRELYGQVHPEVAVEFMTCRVTSSGPDRDLGLPGVDEAPRSSPDSRARKGTRPVHFGEHGFLDASVLDRYALRAGDVVNGPAVVEERESTVVIPPEMDGSVDSFGNLIVRVRK